MPSHSCTLCHYTTAFKQNYNLHMNSKRHNARVRGGADAMSFACKKYQKPYQSYSGMWKHSQRCTCVNLHEKPPVVLGLE